MSEPKLMSQDEEHLRLLTMGHYVCAGIAVLCACIPIFHLVLGLLMLFAPDVFNSKNEPPPRFVGLFFVGIGTFIIALGWTLAGLLAWAGRCLGRRTHYTYCFVMACVACLFQPFGTVLGIFTIFVLLRPSVKQLFGRPGWAA